jgi:predicted transcriptional regulator
MPPDADIQLSRRERQILDILFARGSASTADVIAAMTDAPSYSAVRALLRILEDKGHVKHKKDGLRYVYVPTRSRSQASRSSLRRVLDTFFDGSVEKAVAGLLDAAESKPTREELERLSDLIERAKATEAKPAAERSRPHHK